MFVTNTSHCFERLGCVIFCIGVTIRIAVNFLGVNFVARLHLVGQEPGLLVVIIVKVFRIFVIRVEGLSDVLVEAGDSLSLNFVNTWLEHFVLRSRFIGDAWVNLNLLGLLVDEVVGILGPLHLEEVLVDVSHLYLLSLVMSLLLFLHFLKFTDGLRPTFVEWLASRSTFVGLKGLLDGVITLLIVGLGGCAKHSKLSLGVSIVTLCAVRHASNVHDIQILLKVASLVSPDSHLSVLDGLFTLRRELWRHLLSMSLLSVFLLLVGLMPGDFIGQRVV
jgi:hypothetical protein